MRNALLMLVVLLVAACAPQAVTNSTNDTNNISNETQVSLPQNFTKVRDQEQQTDTEPRDFAATLRYTEGDTVKLRTRASDPDGDSVTITYGAPMNADGTWQTKVGDAGDYVVTVTATDDKGASTEQQILLTILHANRAPVLEGPDSVDVKEGDVVEIPVTASDPDGDEVLLSYSGWMQSSSYRTTYDDAGTHNVTVIGEDGKLSTKKTVTVNVENVNRPPQIELGQDTYTTVEEQPLAVHASSSDPDGDEVTITYGAPLNADGTWTPKLDEAGNYTATVTATDSNGGSVTKDVKLVVERANRPPVIDIIGGSELNYAEGDFIDLRKALNITDEEGEDVTVVYSGWMNQSTYQTTYDDAGEHTVTVTARDGSDHATSRDIKIVVSNTNRPPVFTRPA